MYMVGYEEFKRALPKGKKKMLTPEVYEEIKKLNDSDLSLREDLLGYANVLEDTRYTIKQYVLAVKYVAYKQMGHTNFDAFNIVFPDKIKEWKDRGLDTASLHKKVTKYNRSPIVVAITKQSVIPVWILNQDVLQEAINVNRDLMYTSRSEMVRQKAASDLMNFLKQPEDTKATLDINIKEDDTTKQLEETLLKLSKQQLEHVEMGKSTPKQIAEMDIITVEVEDEDEEKTT